MAKLSCVSMHQQLLQPNWGAPGSRSDGFLQPKACPSRYQMQAAIHRGHDVTSMIQPMRLASVGKRTIGVSRRNVVLASTTTREDFGSGTSSALGFTDSTADISGRSIEDESVASDGEAVNETLRGHELENLIHGPVGRLAFLGILLMGVGVTCLTNVGDAEAAASHISNSSGDVDMRALALGPEGPLLEEFWDNMRRYGLYFLTVVTGGVYQLVKPAVDALRNPVTAVLIIVIVTGSIYLVSLTVSAMLGINEFQYDYAV